MANKEISLSILQKLWPLAISETLTEMFFKKWFLLHHPAVNAAEPIVGWMKAGGSTNCLVNIIVRSFKINRRSSGRSMMGFVHEICAGA
jgi:hypothetical protein